MDQIPKSVKLCRFSLDWWKEVRSIKRVFTNISFIQKHRAIVKKLQHLLYLLFMNSLCLPYYKFVFLIFGIDYICGILLRAYSGKKILFLLSNFGATIDSNVQIYPPIIVDNAWVTGDFSNLYIERDVYVGRQVFFDLSDEIIIGQNTAISARVGIITHMDTGPVNPLSSYYPRKTGKVEIGSNSWIGFGVVILSGVTIGDFVAAGAGAVINKNIPGYSVVCGVPAKIVKKLEKEVRDKT